MRYLVSGLLLETRRVRLASTIHVCLRKMSLGSSVLLIIKFIRPLSLLVHRDKRHIYVQSFIKLIFLKLKDITNNASISSIE